MRTHSWDTVELAFKLRLALLDTNFHLSRDSRDFNKPTFNNFSKPTINPGSKQLLSKPPKQPTDEQVNTTGPAAALCSGAARL